MKIREIMAVKNSEIAILYQIASTLKSAVSRMAKAAGNTEALNIETVADIVRFKIDCR